MKEKLMRKLPLDHIMGSCEKNSGLKRSLGAFELTMLGVGVIIGSGLFVITGVAAADRAGPGLILSFILAGLACACAALCYAELASAIPVSGSSYTFAYVGLGEIFGWFIGWCITLEYVVAMSAIAVGWSAYAVNILELMGIHLPEKLITDFSSGGIMNHYFDHGNAAALGNERKCEAEQYPGICKTGSDPAVHNPCSEARGSIELHTISSLWLERCIFRSSDRFLRISGV